MCFRAEIPTVRRCVCLWRVRMTPSGAPGLLNTSELAHRTQLIARYSLQTHIEHSSGNDPQHVVLFFCLSSGSAVCLRRHLHPDSILFSSRCWVCLSRRTTRGHFCIPSCSNTESWLWTATCFWVFFSFLFFCQIFKLGIPDTFQWFSSVNFSLSLEAALLCF